MTRREETELAWLSKAVQSNHKYDEKTFKEAVEWADKTMIEKSCEWIESYLFDIGFPDDWCRDSATMKSGKQRFLEAMEE